MQYNKCLLGQMGLGKFQGDEWEMKSTSNRKNKKQKNNKEINKSSECHAGSPGPTRGRWSHTGDEISMVR